MVHLWQLQMLSLREWIWQLVLPTAPKRGIVTVLVVVHWVYLAYETNPDWLSTGGWCCPIVNPWCRRWQCLNKGKGQQLYCSETFSLYCEDMRKVLRYPLMPTSSVSIQNSYPRSTLWVLNCQTQQQLLSTTKVLNTVGLIPKYSTTVQYGIWDI